MLILADAFGNIRHGIQQRVFQQVDTVILPVISLHSVLVVYLCVLVGAFHRIFVNTLRVGYPHIRFKQVLDIGGIDTGGNPAFTEIEIQLVERNRSGQRFFQYGECLVHPLVSRVIGCPHLYLFRLFHYVPGDEAVFNLIIVRQRIKVDAPFELSDEFLPAVVAKCFHVVEVHLPVTVQ